MNLFFARLTGKLPSTERFAKDIRALRADAKRLHELEQSDLVKEYEALKAEISAPIFLNKKADLQKRKYKDTKEAKTYEAFLRLKKSKMVRLYQTAQTEEERNKYVGTLDVREYEKLKVTVENPDFEERRLFWKNSKRWNTTPEAAREARFKELEKHPDIIFFKKVDKRRIAEMESWHETFHAGFHEPELAKSGFKTGFWFKDKNLKTDFSYRQEAQAYMGERNLEIYDDTLSIITRKENVTAPAWDPRCGFIMHDFAYTSANVNTGDSFQQSIGLFRVKVRATGKAHGGIYLVGENRFPLIELYHYNGKHIIVGITDKNGRTEEVLKGLPAGDWQTLAVAVNSQEIVWSVNNYEVFRTKNPLPGQKLYITAQGFAPTPAEGQMDIKWVKVLER